MIYIMTDIYRTIISLLQVVKEGYQNGSCRIHEMKIVAHVNDAKAEMHKYFGEN